MFNWSHGHGSRLGESPNTWKHFGPARTRAIESQNFSIGRLGNDGFWDQDYGWGSGYTALLAYAGGALYSTELGLVTLKRIGFFCFPIKHSTHTQLYHRSCSNKHTHPALRGYPSTIFGVFVTPQFLSALFTGVGRRSTLGPRWVNRGSPTFGSTSVGPAQKSSTVGPRDQFSLLRALGNQTKLSTFDTVAFRVRRRPDRLHARRRAPPLHSPCQKFGNTDYFFKLPIKAPMRGSMKLWEAAQ